jgi:hypothetical protein
MSRKHNTKHRRSPSNYKKRLEDRGLSRTPTMRWTGRTTAQITEDFAKLPHYRWQTRIWTDDSGYKHANQVRELIA